MSDKHIYFDYAATSPVDHRVLEAMLPYFSKNFGNPESEHFFGHQAKQDLDQAKEKIAEILNCRAEEIIFTGSATEANNLALFGIAETHKKGHIISSKIEHPSILEPLKKLEKKGFEVSYLDVDKEGFINPKDLEKEIRPDTILVSIIYANNEIGSIQNIKKIGEICHNHKIPFHTDACQAANTKSLDTKELNLDLMTLNGSKVYGPKGIGLLFKKSNISLSAQILGGGHQKGLRSGTQNLSHIIGFTKALELAQEEREEASKRLSAQKEKIVQVITTNIPKAKLNSPLENSLENIINISFPGIGGKELLLHLDTAGICISTGSACSTNKSAPSHVLKAIGCSEKEANGSIRISLGKPTTDEEIDYLIDTLPAIVKALH